MAAVQRPAVLAVEGDRLELVDDEQRADAGVLVGRVQEGEVGPHDRGALTYPFGKVVASRAIERAASAGADLAHEEHRHLALPAARRPLEHGTHEARIRLLEE